MAQTRPDTFPASRRRVSSRRATGWIAIPLATATAVISPANPTDRWPALVTSSGSTTKASDAIANTHGAAGAMASQKRADRTACGGHTRPPAPGVGA